MERFPKGARVCFVGDSITHANRFVSHIVNYYRTHFPEDGVEFYNCGTSGGTLRTALAVFEEDVVPLRPTHAVLMLGINDSARGHLNTDNPDRYSILEAAYREYQTNLSLYCERLTALGAKITLCTPAPYAEYIESTEPPLRGGAALMLGYSAFLKAFAKERKLPLCDYNGYLTRLLTQGGEPLYGPDRVHPTNEGHFRMAQCFLAFQGLTLSSRELSEEILPWDKAVRSLRDAVATVHFLLHDDFSASPERRMEVITAFAEHPEEGPHKAYFTALAKAYPEHIKHQKENTDLVLRFMKQR